MKVVAYKRLILCGEDGSTDKGSKLAPCLESLEIKRIESKRELDV